MKIIVRVVGLLNTVNILNFFARDGRIYNSNFAKIECGNSVYSSTDYTFPYLLGWVYVVNKFQFKVKLN
jgi:hypothetical protein